MILRGGSQPSPAVWSMGLSLRTSGERNGGDDRGVRHRKFVLLRGVNSHWHVLTIFPSESTKINWNKEIFEIKNICHS